jgi:hypothetical protein
MLADLNRANRLAPAPNDEGSPLQIVEIPGDIPTQTFKILSSRLHIKTALQFISQRDSNTTLKFLRDCIMEMYSTANLLVGNAKMLYNIGKTSFVLIWRKDTLQIMKSKD